MGTWVEIHGRGDLADRAVSSPAWGRGLKYDGVPHGGQMLDVVPRMGTWVEISSVPPHPSGAACRPPHGDVG